MEKSSEGHRRRPTHFNNSYNQTTITNETLISRLRPSTLYKFTVAAININGQGEKSSLVTLTMDASEGKCFVFILFCCLYYMFMMERFVCKNQQK